MPKTANRPPKTANRPWYEIHARDNDTAEVLIYGDIGDSWFGESVTAAQFVKDLQGLKDKNLVVRINSYGGSVADGVAIHNAIKRHPKQKDVSIDGVAVSIASLIAMAGDTVTMADNAMFMVHAPWGMAMGNSKVMRDYADLLDKYAESMATSYAAKSGESVEAMYELLSDGDDHWYSAEEAQAAGFVDEITTAILEEEAARFRQAAFNRYRAPAAIAAAFQPKEVSAMPQLKDPAAEPGKTPTPDNVTDIEKAAEARARERLQTRNKEITTAFSRFMIRDGISALHAECIADVTLTLEQARDKLLAKLGEGAGPISPAGRVEAGEDARDKRIVAMGGALAMRMAQAKDDAANPYRGMRMHELARACLKACGVNVEGMDMLSLSSMALTRGIPRGAQTTSDFPVILENTLHKLVLTGFMAQQITYDRFCKLGDVSDFRAWNRLVPGLIGNLDSVNEHGEYVNKNLPDAQKNSVQATRKGNIINVTPEVIVNDDIGYIQTLASSLGAAGNRAVERAVYTLLNANPTLSDGVALFHATHANLAGSGAVPSVATFDAARVAMASQTAPGVDAEYLDIRPAVAVVPMAQGGNSRVLVNAVYDPDTANKLQKPNMVNGIVKDVVDSPRLSGTPWYFFADPNIAPVIEVVFLDGQRTPKVTEEIEFRTSGLAWKVELPFGVGAVDFRGGYKNPGA